MNILHLGFNNQVTLPKGGYLFISDKIPKIPHALVFDHRIHSLNPLAKLDYKSARELVDALYAVSPQGENTLTVRNGRRALLPLLLSSRRLDAVDTDDPEVRSMLDDILISPVLRRVLSKPTNFSFPLHAKILVRLDRSELGDFDALLLGLFLINRYKGQLVIPDFGFYGRNAHASLIRENRLIAGVQTLSELPLRLRQAILSIPDRRPSRALYEDAVTLAHYASLLPGTNAYNDFIDAIVDPS